MKKYKINKSVSLKIVEILTKTRLISSKRNRMLFSVVSSVGARHGSRAESAVLETFLRNNLRPL